MTIEPLPTDALFDLTDRVAVVTGASRGLGAATARRLGEAGCDVVLTYNRRAEGAEATAQHVRDAGRRAWVVQCNLAERDDITALMDIVESDVGGLDLLVANAAQTKFGDLMDVQPHHVERTFGITVAGFLHLVQRAVPMMEVHGGGRIVAVSGADTQTWIPAHGLLGAAKAAMESLVRYLAIELGRRGVTVVGINPGFIAGDSMKMMLGDFYDGAVEGEAKSHPMGVATTPDHIAETVLLTCTDAARWVNGDTILADGAGVFAFCGRYISASARLQLGAGDDAEGGGPSVKLD